MGSRSGLNSTVIVISKLADWQVGVRYLFLLLVSSSSFCAAVFVCDELKSHLRWGELACNLRRCRLSVNVVVLSVESN